MAEYHVVCGDLSIYAGDLSEEGEWNSKSEVTEEAVAAVAQFLLTHGKDFRFRYNGDSYVMMVLNPDQIQLNYEDDNTVDSAMPATEEEVRKEKRSSKKRSEGES